MARNSFFILQGRVKFPIGGKVREPQYFEVESFKLRYRQYSLDGRRICTITRFIKSDVN